MPLRHLVLPCLLLAACGGGADRDGTADTAAEAALPSPDATAGSVTGMPDRPGPGPVGAAVQAETAASPDTGAEAGTAGFDFADAPVAPAGDEMAPPDALDHAVADGPGAAEAAATVRDYYAALSGRDYAAAYGLWSDEGRASGQTPQQFAGGFADTQGLEAQVGEPGPIEGAAGSRYIQVPVSITARHQDGSTHRYLGNYTLRRAVVDGASAAQRAWRIASADIREVQP